MTRIASGVSVKGSYHDINQDAFATLVEEKGQVIVLADGLGSKKKSQIGAKALCEAVLELTSKYDYEINDIETFLKELHSLWLLKIGNNSVCDCYCTAQFVCVGKDQCKVFKLGDGVTGVIIDENTYVFLDEKDDFVNYTEAMTEKLNLSKWQIASYESKSFKGAYLCSDGVEIVDSSEDGWKNFISDFISSYRNLNVQDIENQVRSWLIDWPGTDDKTISFLLEEDI